MKKPIYFFLALSISSQCTAQPIISNMEKYDVGDQITTMFCDTTGANPGSAGTNQTWDLSALVGMPGFIDVSTQFIQSNPAGSLFPNANIVDSTNGYTDYYNQTDTATYHLGEYVPATDPTYNYTLSFTNTDGLLYARRPISYNDVFTTSYNVNETVGSSSIYSSAGTQTMTADGYGTLITPSGTFNNTLRVKSVQDESGSIITTYRWYDNSHRSALCTIIINGTGANASTNYCTYLISETPGLSVNTTAKAENILKGTFKGNELILNYNFRNGTSCNLQIMNMAGQNVYSTRFTASGSSVQLYPQQLPAGMYVVSLMENNKAGISTLKVVKE